MTKEMDISFNKPYHQWNQRESFLSMELYNKFLNWIRGEFDLYLQDEQNDLDVFFPNGNFNIKHLAENKEDILIEINVKSKDLRFMNVIINQITSIHNQIENIYSK